jgi:hypothetical protein
MAAKSAAKPPRRQAFFESEALDQLLSMILELATELWVVRERLYTLERASAQLGIPLAEAVEAYKFSKAEAEELSALRQQMLGELMRNVGRPHKKTTRTFAKGKRRR